VKFFVAEQNIGGDATREEAEQVVALLRQRGWDVSYGVGKNVATEVSEFGKEAQIQDRFADDFMVCIAEMESGRPGYQDPSGGNSDGSEG